MRNNDVNCKYINVIKKMLKLAKKKKNRIQNKKEQQQQNYKMHYWNFLKISRYPYLFYW